MKTSWSERQSFLDRWIENAVRGVVLNFGRIFYRVKVVGRENLPVEGGVVFVCNHVSYTDTIPLSMAVKRRFRFTSYEGLFQRPILGRCLRAFGSIPVSARSARETIRTAVNCAASGESVLLFPEGKLTLDGNLQEIKAGYLLVAEGANVPVVMVHMDGLWGSIFSFEGGRWFFKWPSPWRRDVTITFSDPQDVRSVSPERLAAFWKSHAKVEAIRDVAARIDANADSQSC